MLYSVKMRAAQGGAHEKGGRHISGAERILSEEKIEQTVLEMLHRAKEHQRGVADFVSLKIEAVHLGDICYQPLLPFYAVQADTLTEGRKIAFAELVKIGVSKQAAAKGFEYIKNLCDSMHGAMLVDAQSGKRIDELKTRGVRVSKMDCDNSGAYERKLCKYGLLGAHVREALVLASKVAGGEGVLAELCWSDDPDYVTGYVASRKYGYQRIPVLKEKGDPVGGRVFFVKSGTDLQRLINYLENQVVLIRAGEC